NFGIQRFDIEYNAGAACGQYVVTQNNSERNLDRGVDVKTINKQNIAEVFPNPASTNFRLYLSLANQQNSDIEMYSIDGKRVYQKLVPANGIVDIDASRYSSGVYLLKIRQGEFKKTLRLIKQ
ncbi:MAG: T9SS type A sorting domain-containing protein, partial [Bacteroidota bacterium]|nr:T9SS type A sorting domain-containing protein [Bacteroidota bacterium]